MTWTMVPALFGICVKLWLLITAKKSRWVNTALIGFVSVLTIQGFTELLLFHGFNLDWNTNFIIRCYYLSIIAAMTYGFYYSMDSATYPVVKYIGLAICLSAVILSGLIFLTDSVISGVVRLAYITTAIKGHAYWAFQLFTLVSIVGWISCLVLNYRNAVDPKEEVRHFYALIALMPLAILSLILLVLIGIGRPLNATMVIPIVSTLFLIITIRGMNIHDKQQDIRSLVPFSLENLSVNRIKSASAQYALENMSHKELMATIERAAIEYKLKKNNGNVSKTAASMQVERSTLYSKFKILNIDQAGF